jgi:hypothetical protein
MRPIRLSTLLLLVVIAALGMALAIQHERSARREAELLAQMAQEKEFVERRNELNIKILKLEIQTQSAETQREPR